MSNNSVVFVYANGKRPVDVSDLLAYLKNALVDVSAVAFDDGALRVTFPRTPTAADKALLFRTMLSVKIV